MIIMLYDKYDVALRALIGIKDKLTIVIVGANDGKAAGPIYDFVMRGSGEGHAKVR
ncbi:MAG: hypothetical protein QS721_12435 [Candidatus Endonucleobacter sp. (ex Gigantidas childressi)]|nr:hypothetical protein [Candidatus Endonucleobacter sp. (ex Gigantidas childressi)]